MCAACTAIVISKLDSDIEIIEIDPYDDSEEEDCYDELCQADEENTQEYSQGRFEANIPGLGTPSVQQGGVEVSGHSCNSGSGLRRSNTVTERISPWVGSESKDRNERNDSLNRAEAS